MILREQLSEEFIEHIYNNSLRNYRILEGIGQGTYGKVEKARNTITNKIFAIKFFRNRICNSFIPRSIRREINILSQIKHENIISLVDVCSTQCDMLDKNMLQFCMVLEYCKYSIHSLFCVNQCKFTNAEVKRVIKMLFEGLRYLHNNFIIHRDIKPKNVLINTDGILKIIDFGLARIVDTDPMIRDESYFQRMSPKVGTREYQAPEITSQKTQYGGSVDIWGAGCTILEMYLHGKLFSERRVRIRTEGSCEYQINHRASNSRRNCLCNSDTLSFALCNCSSVSRLIKPYVKDEGIIDLLSRIFQINPDKRPNSQDVLEHDIFRQLPFPAESIQSLQNFNDRAKNSVLKFDTSDSDWMESR